MPTPVGPEDIEAAAGRIGAFTRTTPTLDVGPVAGANQLTLKLEFLQVTGSFKARGAFNQMLAAEVTGAGVAAASGGNFGIAVAHAARVLGHHAEIFIPGAASPEKVARIRREDAAVTVVPGYYPEAAEACRTRARESGALLMHAYDHPDVVAGQGTVGMEIAAQVPEADTVLVAVGGAGLIGGVAAWFGGDRKVVGVEPELCPNLHEALLAGRPVDSPVGGIAADALGSGRVGEIGFAVAAEHVSGSLLVSDAAIREAQDWLWKTARIAAEPGGAASLAGLLSGAYEPAAGEHVVAIICGANTDREAST